jgi:hypothetical protein
MGMVVVAPLAASAGVSPVTTIRSTLRRTSSAASSGRRPLFSANRYSMVIFFPSIHPSLLSSCRNASTSTVLPEAVLGSRKPMRKVFPGCCASVLASHNVSTTARIDNRAAFFIEHLVREATI